MLSRTRKLLLKHLLGYLANVIVVTLEVLTIYEVYELA
jgi:hypothetical protein